MNNFKRYEAYCPFCSAHIIVYGNKPKADDNYCPCCGHSINFHRDNSDQTAEIIDYLEKEGN